MIARARALLPPKEEKPEDPLDAVERRARLMCGKPEVEDAAAPEEIDEEFDPLLARAKALSLHASRVAAELESQPVWISTSELGSPENYATGTTSRRWRGAPEI